MRFLWILNKLQFWRKRFEVAVKGAKTVQNSESSWIFSVENELNKKRKKQIELARVHFEQLVGDELKFFCVANRGVFVGAHSAQCPFGVGQDSTGEGE